MEAAPRHFSVTRSEPLAFSKLSRTNNRFRSQIFCGLYFVFRRLAVPQSLDPQHGRADGDAELQDCQNNQQSIHASEKHLVGCKNIVDFKLLKHICYIN